eukprot:4044367-Alexandrium_andersonii.AAC.1
MLVDGRMYWDELKPFCATCKGRNAIDTWHHGDEGMQTPARADRLAYLFDKHMQQVAFLALASSTPQFMRVATQGSKMKKDWLGDLGAVLHLA